MPSGQKRARQMASMRADGLTLAEVGEHFGLSRERVRQVLLKHGYDPTKLKRTASRNRTRAYAAALQHEVAEHGNAIRRRLLDGQSIQHIASALGVSRPAVRAVNSQLGGVARRTSKASHRPKYTDPEILDCLRLANMDIGGVMTGDDYNRLADTRRFVDGRDWPGKQTAMLRFGSWKDALEAAGLPSNRSSAIRGQRLFEREHCIDAVLEAARAVGHLPTHREYDDYAASLGGILPSGSTIRHRFGGWTAAIRAAAEFSSRMPSD